MDNVQIGRGAVVRRAHVNKEYFILEKDGIPVAGILDADELEDYLELRDPKVREHIRKSHEDFLAGKSRPAGELLQEGEAHVLDRLDDRGAARVIGVEAALLGGDDPGQHGQPPRPDWRQSQLPGERSHANDRHQRGKFRDGERPEIGG